MANSVDPDQTPRPAASDQGLHCLLSHICPSSHPAFLLKCFSFFVSLVLYSAKFCKFFVITAPVNNRFIQWFKLNWNISIFPIV